MNRQTRSFHRRLPGIVLTAVLLGTALFSSAIPTPAAPQAWQARVDPRVLAAASGGQTEFLVYLNEQADLSAAAALPTKAEKGAYVYRQLNETARRTQGFLLSELESEGVEHQSFWVANMIWVRGNIGVVKSLAQHLEVAHIYANPSVSAAPASENQGQSIFSAGLPGPRAPTQAEWNISHVGAPQVWEAGYTGQGVVIGGQDTGYEWEHPALQNQYRGWDGSAADHNYNWHDAIHTSSGEGDLCPGDSSEPCDDNGHGTHTMGTMVGNDGAGAQIGMAPGARWIGCRNMDSGVGTPASYAECYQWFIAPTRLDGSDPDPSKAPDIINNSWSCTPSEGCSSIAPEVLQAVVESVRAAGILSVHSAGNSGSACSSINQPAAIYDASFSVANTTSTDELAYSSSRGPVTIDGSNRLKPDIAAPGTGIYSSTPSGRYATLSGTSMAGPHVAGLAALLLSIRPELAGQVDVIERIITHTAVHLTYPSSCGGYSGLQSPNPFFGWGRIDAYAAMRGTWMEMQTEQTIIEPGGLLTFTLSVAPSLVSIDPGTIVLTNTVPEGTSFITASSPYTIENGTVRWEFPAEQALDWITVTMTVQGPAFGQVVNADYGASYGSYQIPINGSAKAEFALLSYIPLITTQSTASSVELDLSR